MFRPIPIGSTDGALDQLNLALPEKIDTTGRVAESAAREQARGPATTPTPTPISKPKVPTPIPTPAVATQPQTGGDIFDMMDGPSPVPAVQPQPVQIVQPPAPKPPQASSFEDIFFSDARPTAPVPTPPIGTLSYGQPQVPVQPQLGGFGGLGGLDLLGGQSASLTPVNTGFGGLNLLGGTSMPTPIQPQVQPINTGFMGGLNFGINPPPAAQVRAPVQNTGGLDLLGGFSLPSTNPTPAVNTGLIGFGTPSTTPAPTASLGFNLLGPQPVSTPAANFLSGTPISNIPTNSAFRAY